MIAKNKINIFATSAARVNLMGSADDGSFPGADTKNDSLTDIIAFNGDLTENASNNLKKLKDVKIHNTIYNKHIGAFLNNEKANFGINLNVRTKAGEETEPLYQTLKMERPFYPSTMTEVYNEETLKHIFDKEGSLITRHEAKVDSKGVLDVSFYANKEVEGKSGFENIEFHDMNDVIRYIAGVKHSVIVVKKNTEGKMANNIALVGLESGYSESDIREEIKATLREEVGNVRELSDIIIVENVSEDYNWP